MNVVILDTGCANLSSVKWAVERLGYAPEVSRHPDVVLRADKLFLPGVGTAQAAMNQLLERELIELVKACTQPVLGICLGSSISLSRFIIPILPKRAPAKCHLSNRAKYITKATVSISPEIM